MFIETEQTPNPATLKFIPGHPILATGTADFPRAEAATCSPLATRLFRIEGVSGVFFGPDFVSVSKVEGIDWPVLKTAVLGALMEHLASGQPVIDGEEAAIVANDEEDNEIVVQIKELLNSRVRPAVAQDGGDIVYKGFEEGIVFLHLQGACAGCPSSTATLKMGIENLLRHYIPEVMGVESV